MPLLSLGLTFIENSFFRWGLSKPRTMRFINRYLGGALFTALRLDLLPILRSSALFYLYDDYPSESCEAKINQGRMIQRFWLNAEKCGIVIQPCYIFPVILNYAKELKQQPLADKINAWSNNKNIFFSGRIGYAIESNLHARSTRLPLDQLLI
jgi:hypothetical protein